MVSYPRTFFILISIAIFLTGCEEEGTQVDEQYVESPQYEAFQNQIKRENDRHHSSLKEYIVRLAECDIPHNMKLPLSISGETIEKYISDAPEECVEYETEYPTTVLGRSRLNDLDLVWLLVESHSVFDERELILITRKKGELQEYRTMGVFSRNLSTVEETFVRVTPENGGAVIFTETTSSREYPIGQQYEIESEYKVNRMGQITEAES